MIRKNRHHQGQAVVEFALILPIFLLLVFAITEFGRVWMTQHVLTSASRVGARKAILPTSTTAEVVTEVNSFCQAANLDVGQLNVASSNVGVSGSSGATTSVTVTYPFSVLSGSMVPGLQGTITLSSTTQMRHE